jgi:hypothetical protein
MTDAYKAFLSICFNGKFLVQSVLGGEEHMEDKEVVQMSKKQHAW